MLVSFYTFFFTFLLSITQRPFLGMVAFFCMLQIEPMRKMPTTLIRQPVFSYPSRCHQLNPKPPNSLLSSPKRLPTRLPSTFSLLSPFSTNQSVIPATTDQLDPNHPMRQCTNTPTYPTTTLPYELPATSYQLNPNHPISHYHRPDDFQLSFLQPFHHFQPFQLTKPYSSLTEPTQYANSLMRQYAIHPSPFPPLVQGTSPKFPSPPPHPVVFPFFHRLFKA